MVQDFPGKAKTDFSEMDFAEIHLPDIPRISPAPTSNIPIPIIFSGIILH